MHKLMGNTLLIIIIQMIVQASESISYSLWDACCLFKNTCIGTISVGLFIGSIYFSYYLLRLSKLPKSSREYRQLSYHMQSQTLLRYTITISCLIVLNILIYAFFQAGRTSIHIGILVWLIYFVVGQLRKYVKTHQEAGQKQKIGSSNRIL